MREVLDAATREYSPVMEDQGYLESFLDSIRYLPEPDFLEAQATAVYMMKSFRDAGRGPRDDGSPWCSHSLQTGEIMAVRKVNLATIQKGLLHDIEEDTNITFPELTQLFGDDVVDGVIRLSKLKHDRIPYHEKDEILQANLFEAVIDNPGAAFVRLCERLHNLRTIEARFVRDRGRAIATCEETLAVYVPLAWRLGLYDEANEMAIHALSLLKPEFVKRLDQIIPGFSDNKLKIISRIITNSTNLGEDRFRIFSPSYSQLAEALKDRGSIEDLNTDNVPAIVDFHIEKSEEAGILLHRLVGSGWFDIDAHSLQDFYTDISRGVDDRSLYITLRTKTTRSIERISIRINFLSAKQIMERQAAIFHLIQTESEEDTQMKALAQAKIEKERGELARLKLMAPTAQIRARLYEASLARGMMVATIAFPDGYTEKIDVFNRSSVLDVLLQAVHSGKLSFEDFVRISHISIGARRSKLNQTVDAMSELVITIHPTESHLKPEWLRALNTTIPDQRKILSQELRRLVDSGRLDIINEAEEFGEKIILEEYRRLSHVEVLKVKVSHGFDPNLLKKYPDESEFLVAVGIGEIDTSVIKAVINRISEYRKSLASITILVPRGYDQFGWAVACDEILKGNRISIVESSFGQSSRRGIDAFLIYHFEPGLLDGDDLMRLRMTLADKCKSLFDLPEIPKVVVGIPKKPTNRN